MSKKHRVSARRQVIDNAINQTREIIISTELDLKYLNIILESDSHLMSDEQKAMFDQEAKFLESSIKSHIKKLEFYKNEKKMLLAKDAMRNYDSYPATISMNNLEEVK